MIGATSTPFDIEIEALEAALAQATFTDAARDKIQSRLQSLKYQRDANQMTTVNQGDIVPTDEGDPRGRAKEAEKMLLEVEKLFDDGKPKDLRDLRRRMREHLNKYWRKV